MDFILFITPTQTKRQFFGGRQLEIANIYKNDDCSVSLELEDEDGDFADSFVIQSKSQAANGKVYDRVCDALIKHSNIIDLRGIECYVCVVLDSGLNEEL